MSIREIASADWPAFLDEFSRGHRTWLATVESMSPGGSARPEAIARPLRSVTPTMRASRVVRIEIRFQQDSHARRPVSIERPVSLRVEETNEGTAKGMEIVDEDGQCTRLRFRSAPPSEQLDGIAPGELPQM
jgi:hypothetical protein